MTPELSRYYEETFSMFGTLGWKYLMEDFRQMEESTNQIAGVKPEDLRFKQGELSIIQLVLNREKMCIAAYEQLKGDSNVDPE